MTTYPLSPALAAALADVVAAYAPPAPFVTLPHRPIYVTRSAE